MAFVKDGPSVQFSLLCWQKMWALVHACDIEISWFMYSATDEEKEQAGITADFYFTDVYVVNQICSGVKSDMVGTAVGDLCSQLLDEGKDPSLLNGFGHSHVNMGVSPSGTDEATFERLQSDPLISIILNKKGEVYLRCDTWEPWRHSYLCSYSVDDIPLISESWGKEMVKEHVEKEKPIQMTHKGWSYKSPLSSSKKSFGGYGGYGYEQWDGFDYGEVKSNTDDIAEVTFLDDIDDTIRLDKEFYLLEECYRDGVVNINEVLDLYKSVSIGEMTIPEMEDLLNQYFGEASEKKDDTKDVDDEDLVSENPTLLQTNKILEMA